MYKISKEEKDSLSYIFKHKFKDPLIFATISGSHLYGFHSKDSDYDIRGINVLPIRDVIGLQTKKETTVNNNSDLTVKNNPVDYEFHDVRKFCHLLRKHNANQLEQLYSPLVVYSTEYHELLKGIAKGCFTSTMFYHFTNFAKNEWKDFQAGRKKVKKLLYLFRLMMCGMHLMKSGELISDINLLNDMFKLSYINDLIDIKKEGQEAQELFTPDMGLFKDEYERFLSEFEDATNKSKLPKEVPPETQDQLNRFVITVREAYWSIGCGPATG